MKRLEISDTPSLATNYEMDDGRIYRIYLEVKTPPQNLATADYVEVETRGYEINKAGAFIVDGNFEPITLRPQRARIPLSNVRNGTDSAKPGWIKTATPADEAEAEELLKGARKLKHLPKTGVAGEQVVVDDQLYTFTDGLYDTVKVMRLQEAPKVEEEAQPLDPETVASLLP